MNLRTILSRLRGRHPGAEAGTASQHRELVASLLVMAWMVEARDPYTGGHLWRVSRFAQLLAESCGWGAADTARVAIGGFLHDLGKIGIPDAILTKPERLTDEEYETVRTHPDIGARLLAGHPLAALVCDAVLFHHERPDGRGYPHRRSGPAIPADARIVGICDAFDAMTSARPYRKGMPIDAAMAIIRDGLGSQFDAAFGKTFLSLRDLGVLEHIVGHSDDGIPLQTCMMCGPTLVLRRENRPGDQVYCRSCGGEYVLSADAHQPVAVEPTGQRGDAAALEAAPDISLIGRFVRETAARVPLTDMLANVPEGSRA